MKTNPWTHPRTGEVRRYINFNEWTEAAGFDIGFYNTGNVQYAYWQGEKFANGRARLLQDVKVWVDAEGTVHVAYWPHRVEEVVPVDEVVAELQKAWDEQ